MAMMYAIRRRETSGHPVALWSRKRKRWLGEKGHPIARLRDECEYKTEQGANRVARSMLRKGVQGLEWGRLHVTGYRAGE